MENVTIGQIVGVIGSLGVLAGFFFGIYNFVKKVMLDKIEQNTKDITLLKANIGKEIEKLKERTNEQDTEIKESKSERLILLKAQLASLKGLKEQGCNGPVTQAINDIENYLINKSHN